ncbi:MAG: hypothetical protein QM767_13900 [Anaeromyxobacter sp.]
MRRRVATRYVVRDREGHELIVPTLATLHHLYLHGFLSDDDQVRPERSQRWETVRDYRGLDGARETRPPSARKVLLVLGALVLVALALGLLFGR